MFPFAAALRVDHTHGRATAHKSGHNGKRRRIAHIIGVWLEGYAQHSDFLAIETAIAQITQFFDHAQFNCVIHADHCFHNLLGSRKILTNPRQGLGVLGETRPTIPWPCM